MDYFATGVMSGTSLDGLDIAHCSFRKNDSQWDYAIIAAETVPYSNQWQHDLKKAAELSGRELTDLHFRYGHFIGTSLNKFFTKHHIATPEIISSHGHTIFHRPDLGYTFQLGSGAAIAAEVASKVICDFRSLDVSLKGQGAPLVPVGDQLLFPDYDYCVNLGGFANTSFDANNKRMAYDICPLNFVINRLVEEEKIPARISHPLPAKRHEDCLRFDPQGSLAEKGRVDQTLLESLNQLAYYKITGAKSLGAEWVNENIWPLIEGSELEFHDKLRTFYEHAAFQIGRSFSYPNKKSVLLTGGGCYNDFLIKLIRAKSPEQIAISLATPQIIEFKEAMIFAFLGLLFSRGETNCLAAVTGSKHNNIGGSLFQGTARS